MRWQYFLSARQEHLYYLDVETDRLKEEIRWLKVVYGILVATDISLIAWMAQNDNQAAVFLLLACTMGVLG